MSVMSNSVSVPLSEEYLYPSADGQPMAETELHGDEMTELKLMLRRRYRSRRDSVYVGSNLFVYFEEGNPRSVFSPDVMVVFGAPQLQYRTYKLWRDGPAPRFVLEVTSKSTKLEDKGNKKGICETLGVVEYFLYDPLAEYLEPPLQGYRIEGRSYAPIRPNADGALEARTLGLTLSLDSTGLFVVRDSETGARLLRLEEYEESLLAGQNEIETARVEAEAARVEAEAALAKAESERDAEREARAALQQRLEREPDERKS